MLKVKCVVCGKITAGRLPRASRHDVGDGTFLFPRRHKVSGVDCPGNIEEGEDIEPSNNRLHSDAGESPRQQAFFTPEADSAEGKLPTPTPRR